MKKIFIALFLGMIMSFGFCSCSSDDSVVDDTEIRRSDLYGLWKVVSVTGIEGEGEDTYYVDTEDYDFTAMLINPDMIMGIKDMYDTEDGCDHVEKWGYDLLALDGLSSWYVHDGYICGFHSEYLGNAVWRVRPGEAVLVNVMIERFSGDTMVIRENFSNPDKNTVFDVKVIYMRVNGSNYIYPVNMHANDIK